MWDTEWSRCKRYGSRCGRGRQSSRCGRGRGVRKFWKSKCSRTLIWMISWWPIECLWVEKQVRCSSGRCESFCSLKTPSVCNWSETERRESLYEYTAGACPPVRESSGHMLMNTTSENHNESSLVYISVQMLRMTNSAGSCSNLKEKGTSESLLFHNVGWYTLAFSIKICQVASSKNAQLAGTPKQLDT